MGGGFARLASSSVRRDIDDDRGGVVLTKKIYVTSPRGAVGIGLGRAAGGGSFDGRGVRSCLVGSIVFVGRVTAGGSLGGQAVTTHRDREVGGLRNAGRDGGIKGGGDWGGGDGGR